MKGVLPGLQPEIVQADTLYESFLPFGVDEVSEDELRKCANIVARTVTKEHIKNSAIAEEEASVKESTCCTPGSQINFRVLHFNEAIPHFWSCELRGFLARNTFSVRRHV